MNRFMTDFHNHSLRSRCARPEMTVAAIAEQFAQCGLEMAGISDHGYADGKNAERCLSIRRELAALRPAVDIRVGVELDICYPGRVLIEREELALYDYILVACTHYQNRQKVALPAAADEWVIMQNMIDMMTYAASLPFADAIVHPFHVTGMEEFYPDFDRAKVINRISDEALRRIARTARENEVAIELHESLSEPDYAAAMVRFYRICKQEQVRFSLGSDAHWLSVIGRVRGIFGYLQEVGITEADIWIPVKGKNAD